MGSIRRNIILSNKENKLGAMALVTLEKNRDEIVGTIKTYNIPNTSVILGISCNGEEVFKQSFKISKSHSFVIHKTFNLDSKIACVLVSNENDTITPLVWGSEEENQKYKTQILNSAKQEIQEEKPIKTHKEPLLQPQEEKQKTVDLSELFEIDEESTLNALIEDNLKETNTLLNNETLKLKQNLSEGQIFYDLVADQIQDLFARFPAETNLEQLIPNSKWIIVDYEQNGNVYVLGLIYEDITLKYICYGIPGEYSDTPPKNIESYSQWLPKNPQQPELGGYWVMYQDAINGDSIQIETI